MMNNNCVFSQILAALNLAEKNTDPLLDTQDLLQRMHVSKQTLQRWRRIGLLPYYKIEGKIYYRESELSALIKKHKKL